MHPKLKNRQASTVMRMMQMEGERRRLPTGRKVMVVGGGVAGRAAAQALLDLGIQVILVERSPSSGVADCDSQDANLRVLTATRAVGAERNGAFRIEVESVQGGCRQSTIHEVDAVILTTGLVPIDAGLIPEFGWGRHGNVISAMQLDGMLSAGDIRRPSDGGPVETVVFVQCVGSRVEKRGVPYCSAVCCANAIDCAIKLKQLDPKIGVYILYIDIRTAGKGQEAQYKRARQLDVKFIRGQPALVAKRPGTEKLLVCGENTLLRELYEIPADLVVLGLGLREDPENLELFRSLGVEMDGEGLIRTGDAPDQAVATSAEGVFVAGSASAPMGVEEASAMGTQAAHAAAAYIDSLR
jgi:heterodisulfide reductase subunit A-like polyferredoxin